ncbi:hypothetical protein, partial [Paenibacillus anseongense]|uniref:hypothetical protein n=1 Tax=Paenibacillus anseongense TaxID=2682845 RepID=UPI002DB8F46D
MMLISLHILQEIAFAAMCNGNCKANSRGNCKGKGSACAAAGNPTGRLNAPPARSEPGPAPA